MAAPPRIGSAEPPILAFEDVVKRYGDLRALDGVSFQVNRGEVVCLIGSSALAQRSSVELPEPLGPIRHTTSPRLPWKLTPSSARRSP